MSLPNFQPVLRSVLYEWQFLMGLCPNKWIYCYVKFKTCCEHSVFVVFPFFNDGGNEESKTLRVYATE